MAANSSDLPHQDLTIPSLRGGMNNTDPAPALADDQCVEALNTEVFFSTVGERRGGCDAIDLPPGLSHDYTAAVAISEWFPTNSVFEPELLVVFADPGNSGVAPVPIKRNGSIANTPVWTAIVVDPSDEILPDEPDIYQVRTQALDGELFVAYNSGTNRLHVYDDTTWRKTGLSEPGIPTVTSVGSGSVSGLRYYRVRVEQLDGSVVVRLSEPSDSVSITPTSVNHIHIVLGTVPGEGETNWIVEASPDNGNFYQIATLPIATTSYDDTTADPSQFADEGPLSPAIGAYLTQPSFRFLAVDGGRLLGGSNFNDPSLGSTVYWSPTDEDPGVANSERQPIVTVAGTPITSQLNLDNYAGGQLTGISNAVNGNWYAFKYGRIYMMTRTQDPTLAYNSQCLSTSRGAIIGSIFEGADENGQPSIYFLDPTYGPSRIGLGGIMTMEGLRSTWKRVNLQAQQVVATGCFYKYKRQAHWWVAADGADRPTLKMISQTDRVTPRDNDSIYGCWALADGDITRAFQVATYEEWVIEADDSVTISERPFIAGNASDNATPIVARTDVDTTDMGTPYFANILTKPYLSAGILNWWGAMNFGLLAGADASQSVVIRFVRDFGKESTAGFPCSLAPESTEGYVIPYLDAIVMSHAKAIQIQISDS